MNVTNEQFELIVQKVLERLGTPAVDSAPMIPSIDPPLSAAVSQVARIDEHVVTQALLADGMNGSKQVRIGAKAILTPSARDFVRTGGIEILREAVPARSGASDRWQFVVTMHTPQVAAAIEFLKDHGIAAELRILGTPAEAAAQATSAICRGEATRVVVFSNQPEIVVCLANRNGQVRSAAVADATAVERVQKNLNANVLAIDPLEKSLHELKVCLTTYSKS